MTTAILASNCLYCPKPGDENVGPLVLSSMIFLDVVPEIVDRPDVASTRIPTETVIEG